MKKIITFWLLAFVLTGATSLFAQETIIVDTLSGFKPELAQDFFYRTIAENKDTGNTLVFRDIGSPWYLTGPVKRFQGVNDLTLIFEPGCVIEAKKGYWKAGQILLNVFQSRNLKIIGYGATFKMHKSDFDIGPNGETEGGILESGHCFNFSVSENLVIKGLTIDGSGGDAIRLDNCINGTIEDIDAVGHKRQGISIISCDTLNVRHSRFRNTSGAPPAAGVDIEPNVPSDSVKNCNFTNCSFTGNDFTGIAVALTFMSDKSEAVDITFKDCYLADNNRNTDYLTSALFTSAAGYRREKIKNSKGKDSTIVVGNPAFAVEGLVKFENIAIDGDANGFFQSRKPFIGYKVEMDNVAAINLYQGLVEEGRFGNALIQFEPPHYDYDNGNGGIDFGNTLLHTTEEMAPLRIIGQFNNSEGTWQGYHNLEGKVTMVRPIDRPNIIVGNYDGTLDQNNTLVMQHNASLPETRVNIETTVVEATKSGTLGVATITRSSSRIDYPLFVKYKYESATVKQGDDIHYLTGAVIIGANETEAKVYIEARDNGKNESSRKLELTLEDRPLYTIGSKKTAKLFVSDQPYDLVVNGMEGRITSYAQDSGLHTTTDNNSTLELKGKAWKKVEINYTITPETVLDFELKIDPDNPGRIHGIGFDNNNKLFYRDFPQFFQLAGTYLHDPNDDNEDPLYDYYTEVADIPSDFGNGWKKYSIPVGQFFTGDYTYLTFVSTGRNGEEGSFRNITLRKPPVIQVNEISRPITAYEVADSGTAVTGEFETEVTFLGRSWKEAEVNYTVTPNTWLEFDLKIDPNNPGRIRGIGFDDDKKLYYRDIGRMFYLAGTYKYPIDENEDPIYTYEVKANELADTFNNGWASFEIPVGSHYTGTFKYLTFASSSHFGETSSFNNVKIVERNAGSKVAKATDITSPTINIYPVPATDYVTIDGLQENSIVKLYNTIGQLMLEEVASDNTSLSLEALAKGIYFVQINGQADSYRIVKN